MLLSFSDGASVMLFASACLFILRRSLSATKPLKPPYSYLHIIADRRLIITIHRVSEKTVKIVLS